jgi:hypothetical protein
MKHWLVIVGMLGCGGAAPHVAAPAPIANTRPATKRSVVALTDDWPSQPDAGAIVARTPAGPFPSLSAVCAALDRKESEDRYEGCHGLENDELGGGPFVRTGEVTTWEPLEHDYDMPVRLEYFALQTRAGWYVLPKLGDTGNRYSSLFVQADRAGSGLLLHYQYDLATAGRFASTVEEGVIACEVVAGAAACTPKIATHTYSSSMETSQPDWPVQTNVMSACTASYAKGAITIAPMPKPDGDDEEWTAEAAAGCSGTRAVMY